MLLCHRKNHEFNFDILNYLQLIHKFLIKKNRKTLESKSDENSQLKNKRFLSKTAISEMKWDIPASQYIAKTNNKKSRKKF